MKLALILNPYCGHGKARKRLPEIDYFFRAQKVEFDLFVSRYHNHIPKICADLKLHIYDGIISIGGDGTNFQVLNGLLSCFDPQNIPPLGILPMGSGNSFAKDLKIESLEDGLKSIAGKKSQKVDVLSFSQEGKRTYFINLTGLGFVTDVARTARRFKFLKDFSYLIGIFLQTIGLKSHEMILQADDTTIKGKNCFVEFCNSRYTGGDMLMAPEARINDGLMDIIIVGELGRFSLLKTLPGLFNGTHIEHPAVKYIQTKKAAVVTYPAKPLLPDGEISGQTPAFFNIHPKMVRYFV